MNLVRGIVGIIPGGETLLKNLQESNTLQVAFDWFQGRLAKLNLTWTYVKGLFTKTWAALTASDFLPPTKAFNKVKGIFLSLIAKIRTFAVSAGNKIWELAFEGAMKLAGSGAGRVLHVIKRAGSTFTTIAKDPIGFLGRLIDGVGQRLPKFRANIFTHLQSGLVGWLTGALRGASIQMPDNLFSLEGIFDLVTQVLGVTKQSIRAKAVKLLGERTVNVVERSFKPFVILFNEGPLGLLQFPREEFSNLKELVLDQIQSLLSSQVVQAGIKWMMGLLSPASALLKAAVTIYDIIKFVVEQANQLVEFVNSVVGSIGAIARGAIGGTAKLIEDALAKSLPILIGFLANLIGVGGVAEEVLGVIRRVQTKIDGVLTKVILKVKRLLVSKNQRGSTKSKYTTGDRQTGLHALQQTEAQYLRNGAITNSDAQRTVKIVRRQHPVFQSLVVVDGGDNWDYKYVLRTPKAEDEDKTVNIRSFGRRPRFAVETIRRVLARYKLSKKPKDKDIAHTVAYDTLHERLKGAVNGQSYVNASKLLTKLILGFAGEALFKVPLSGSPPPSSPILSRFARQAGNTSECDSTMRPIFRWVTNPKTVPRAGVFRTPRDESGRLLSILMTMLNSKKASRRCGTCG